MNHSVFVKGRKERKGARTVRGTESRWHLHKMRKRESGTGTDDVQEVP